MKTITTRFAILLIFSVSVIRGARPPLRKHLSRRHDPTLAVSYAKQFLIRWEGTFTKNVFDQKICKNFVQDLRKFNEKFKYLSDIFHSTLRGPINRFFLIFKRYQLLVNEVQNSLEMHQRGPDKHISSYLQELHNDCFSFKSRSLLAILKLSSNSLNVELQRTMKFHEVRLEEESLKWCSFYREMCFDIERMSEFRHLMYSTTVNGLYCRIRLWLHHCNLSPLKDLFRLGELISKIPMDGKNNLEEKEVMLNDILKFLNEADDVLVDSGKFSNFSIELFKFHLNNPNYSEIESRILSGPWTLDFLIFYRFKLLLSTVDSLSMIHILSYEEQIVKFLKLSAKENAILYDIVFRIINDFPKGEINSDHRDYQRIQTAIQFYKSHRERLPRNYTVAERDFLKKLNSRTTPIILKNSIETVSQINLVKKLLHAVFTTFKIEDDILKLWGDVLLNLRVLCKFSISSTYSASVKHDGFENCRK